MLSNKIVYLIILFLFISSSTSFAKIYKGAEYRTNDTFLYGRFEVRYKPANREGVVSSFFTYHDFDNSTGWNEIDFEFIGRYSNSIQFNAITPGQQFHIRTQHINYDPYEDFHDYAFEWTPEYVAWFVDGQEVYRQTGEHVSTLQYPQKIMMNIWNPIYTGWVGYFNDNYLPSVSIYDFVQYSSYTPGNGNYGTDNNFTVEWKDEFDSFDSNRWSKATHTFSGNQADFDPENVVFINGFMHLYLTDEFDKSGTDNIVPTVIWSRANYDSTISIKFNEELTIESAENISNYLLPGGIITKAELNGNKTSVSLYTENYNPYLMNNLIYSGVMDESMNNIAHTQASIIHNVDSIEFPIKINVGGDVYRDYLADQEWAPNLQYGFWMGDNNNYSESIDIIGTDDDKLFRSERKGLITYKFKLPNGLYELNLLFADNTNIFPGKGIFNIHAEKQIVAENIDVVSEVGRNTFYKVDSEVQVSDGILDIYFEEELDSAFVNAIVVNRILTSFKNENQSQSLDKFNLYQNFPNPFNGTTHLKYYLPKSTDVSLKVYDILGNEILSRKTFSQAVGEHRYSWNGVDNYGQAVNSGVYIYQLSGKDFTQSKKMILLK